MNTRKSSTKFSPSKRRVLLRKVIQTEENLKKVSITFRPCLPLPQTRRHYLYPQNTAPRPPKSPRFTSPAPGSCHPWTSLSLDRSSIVYYFQDFSEGGVGWGGQMCTSKIRLLEGGKKHPKVEKGKRLGLGVGSTRRNTLVVSSREQLAISIPPPPNRRVMDHVPRTRRSPLARSTALLLVSHLVPDLAPPSLPPPTPLQADDDF